MRISQGELDRYRAQIASRQDDARAYVLARLRSEARGLTVSEAREASNASFTARRLCFSARQLGLRMNPDTGTVSIRNPAFGTSRSSIPPCDPTNRISASGS